MPIAWGLVPTLTVGNEPVQPVVTEALHAAPLSTATVPLVSATYTVFVETSRAMALGVLERLTVTGVAEHPVVVVALQLVVFTTETEPPAPLATYSVWVAESA